MIYFDKLNFKSNFILIHIVYMHKCLLNLSTLEIRKTICHIADLDNASTFAPNSSSNLPPSYSSPVPSPTYLLVCKITNVNSEYIV